MCIVREGEETHFNLGSEKSFSAVLEYSRFSKTIRTNRLGRLV